MIDISQLKFAYQKKEVLNIKHLSFDRCGLYGIAGPSGCGKTTLLNILSGALSQYQGRVVVDHKELNTLKEGERLVYRQALVSTCYQDPIVFDDLSVYDNLLLKLSVYPTLSTKRKHHLIIKMLKDLNILSLKNKLGKYLSGGEKARIAIARSLLGSAPIVLLDEPSAALDEYHARIVFSRLREEAKKRLIIVVSHNKTLLGDYCHTLIDLSYGQIGEEKHLRSLDTGKKQEHNGKAIITKQAPLRMLFKLAYTLFKSRIKRNTLATATFSFSLVAMCGLLALTSTVGQGIKDSFTLNYQEDTALVRYKKNKPYPYREGLEEATVSQLAKQYKAQYGSIYLNHIDAMFPTYNSVYFQNDQIKLPLDQLTLASFNHVVFTEEIDVFSLYGYRKTVLRDDEIILMLSPTQQRDIYDHLNLRKGPTLERLGNYIVNIQTFITLNIANLQWGYEDEQIYRLVAVVSGNQSMIVHSNQNFSRIVYEDSLRLPVSLKLNTVDEYPWTLKKLYFLFAQDNEAILIDAYQQNRVLLARFNTLFDDEILDAHYLRSRLLMYKLPPNYFPTSALSNQPYTLLTNGGLVSYEQALMTGFSDNFLVGVSEEQLYEVMSYDERRLLDDIKTLIMGPKMFNGHVTLSLSDGLMFNPLKVDTKRINLDEIVLSSEVFNALFGEVYNRQNTYNISIATPKSSYVEEDYLVKKYHSLSLKVVDVIEDKRPLIYHHTYWPLLFFKDIIGCDPFTLIPIGLLTNDSNLVDALDLLEYFEVSYPFQDFAEKINVSLSQMTNLIYLVAFASLLMSFIVLFLVLHTLIDDFYRQLSLLYLFGFSRKRLIVLGLMIIMLIIGTALLTSLIMIMFLEQFTAQLIFASSSMFSDAFPYFLAFVISLFSLIPGLILLMIRVKNIRIYEISKQNL